MLINGIVRSLDIFIVIISLKENSGEHTRSFSIAWSARRCKIYLFVAEEKDIIYIYFFKGHLFLFEREVLKKRIPIEEVYILYVRKFHSRCRFAQIVLS